MGTSTVSFADLKLSEPILRALGDLGFATPTPIQAESIPFILKKTQDLVAFAQTGTGKTAAFSLPIVERVDSKLQHVQALVLCPTRELCMQIERDMASFSKFLGKLSTVAIYGGSSMRDQIRALQNGAQIVIGTPGRVRDLVERGKLKLDRIEFLVLDEADDMLDKGFQEDLDAILDGTPEQKQTLLFSATISPWIKKVIKQRLHNPHQIKVASENKGADTVTHQFVTVHAKDRYEALRRLLDVNPDVYGIVFCKTRRQTQEVADKLLHHNYSAEAIHGEIRQRERSATMKRFREGKVKILVATDVAARGIDVQELTHVINYELPDSLETYVHRSGRTGRAGKEGVSLSIIHLRERGRLRKIEKIIGQRFKQIKVPTGKEICDAHIVSLVSTLKAKEVDPLILEPYYELLAEHLDGASLEEMFEQLIAREVAHVLEFYEDVPDLFVPIKEDRRERSSQRSGKSGGRNTSRKGRVKLAEYVINLGRNDGFAVRDLFKLINKNQSLKGIEIGDIKVEDKATYFEADVKFGSKLLKFVGREKFKGRTVNLRKA